MLIPRLHFPKHRFARSTGWAIKDDDETTISGNVYPAIEAKGGIAKLRLAPSSGRGPAYELTGGVGGLGLGLGDKVKVGKEVKKFLEELEKYEHFSTGQGMPSGTIGPLYYRYGRSAIAFPAAFHRSTWMFFGPELTAAVVNFSIGLICMVDLDLKKPSELPALAQGVADVSGASGLLARQTLIWGCLAGVSVAEGASAQLSGNVIHIIKTEKVEAKATS